MNRPLIVTDCDEVLLHMVVPFREWLAEAHGVDFKMAGHDFSQALTYRANGKVLAADEVWRLLGGFFDSEMGRQEPIAGALAAMGKLRERADVIVLTNLQDHHRESRALQLAGHGLDFRVETNQGPKGPRIAQLVAELSPSRTVFIDDLAQHHQSAATETPDITRLHLCGEPTLAPHIACAHAAGHAHARIDTWEAALPWILARLEEDEDG